MNTTNQMPITKLQKIVHDNPNTIKAFVSKEILDCYSDNIVGFFVELAENGYVLSTFLFEGATHKFFDKYYQEIEKLRHDYEKKNHKPLTIEEDLKDSMAWFAYKTIAFQIAKELF